MWVGVCSWGSNEGIGKLMNIELSRHEQMISVIEEDIIFFAFVYFCFKSM
jgi:hypothetical protein